MSFLKKLFAVGSTVAMMASGFLAPTAALAAAHGAGSVVKTSDGTVWFINQENQRRAFTSAGAFLSYGFLSWAQVVDANSDDTALTAGSFIPPRDGSIFCATATKGTDVAGECALITGGMKAPFTSASVFAGQGYSFANANYGDSSFLSKTSNIDNAGAAHRQGTLVNQNGTVYLVGTSTLLGIPSVDVFNSWGYSFGHVVTANAADQAMTKSGVMCARVPGQLNPSFLAGACPTTPTPGGGNFDPNGGTQGSINSFDLGSRDDTEALEGENDVEIYAVDVDMNDDGPLMVTSADVWFSEVNGAPSSSKPWDYFTEVSLMLNGDVIATQDADSSGDWSSYTNGNINAAGSTREYRMRFSNLDGVLDSDEITKLSVAVSVMNNLDSDDEAAEWFVELGQVRVLDESGFSVNENTDFNTTTTLEESFTMGGAEEAEVEISDADDDVDAQVIEVNKTSNTNGVHIYSFDIEEKNNVDVNIEELTLEFDTSDVPNDVFRRASLWIDGDKVSADKTVPGSGVTVFNNLDIDVDGDTTVTVDVMVDLYDTNNGGRYAEGTTISVEVDDASFIMTDANGNDEDDIAVNGTAESNVHELRTEGIMLDFTNATVTVQNADPGTTGSMDRGTFKINFTATAFGADKRVDHSCELDDGNTAGQGVEFTKSDASATLVSCILTSSSTDNEDNGFVFELDKGVTRNLTLTVVIDGDNDFVEVALASVNWGAAVDNTNANYYTFNLGDFKTGPVFLGVTP